MVVLHDYLQAVIHTDTFEHVLADGLAFLNRTDFLIPSEFAFAAFRIGHSMVREHYFDWSKNPAGSLTNLLGHTFEGGKLKKVNTVHPSEYRFG